MRTERELRTAIGTLMLEAQTTDPKRAATLATYACALEWAMGFETIPDPSGEQMTESGVENPCTTEIKRVWMRHGAYVESELRKRATSERIS